MVHVGGKTPNIWKEFRKHEKGNRSFEIKSEISIESELSNTNNLQKWTSGDASNISDSNIFLI